MVTQKFTNTAREFESSREKDTFAAPDVPHLRSSQKSKKNKDVLNDDLIVSLSDAYENRRARQVSEWVREQSRYVHFA